MGRGKQSGGRRLSLDSWNIDEVYQLIRDPLDYKRWWPAFCLNAKSGGIDEVSGKVYYALFVKGWAPYTLRWNIAVISEEPPCTMSSRVWGDLNGSGRWIFKQDGEYVDCEFDWRVETDKLLLKVFAPLLKPFFRANHYWCMDKCEESMAIELAKRHAASPEEAARVPEPPQTTFKWMVKNRLANEV